MIEQEGQTTVPTETAYAVDYETIKKKVMTPIMIYILSNRYKDAVHKKWNKKTYTMTK